MNLIKIIYIIGYHFLKFFLIKTLNKKINYKKIYIKYIKLELMNIKLQKYYNLK